MVRSRKIIRAILIAASCIYALSFVPIIRDFIRFTSDPIIRPIRHGAESVKNSVQLIFSISSIATENGKLRARVNELSSVSVKNNELQHENDLLKQELKLAPQSNGTLIAAQVITRSASVTQQSIIINKGMDDGFRDGMAVVVQGYLIGRATDVLPRTSRIVLITSAESMLPVVMQKTRSIGLLRGGVEGLIVDEIPRDISIDAGESVITSSIADIVPAGLPIGTVESVVSDASDVFQTARISTPIDLGRLEIVFGVK
jgi:rod shape-determining protein MreC